MNRPKKWMVLVVGAVAIMTSSTAMSQNYVPSNDSPAARMRPIGSASAVDQYQRPAVTSPAMLRETGYQGSRFESGSVRQTAMQFAFPGGPGSNVAPPITSPAPNFIPPSVTTTAPLSPGPLSANPLSRQPLPQFPQQGNPPATLPFPGSSNAAPLQPRSDYAPMNAPSLGSVGGSISNVNNCANVTGPSGYSAAFSSPCGGCAPVGYQAPVPQGFQAPPAQIPAPAILPGSPVIGPAAGLNPGSLSPGSLNPGSLSPASLSPAPVGSLLTFGQERYPVQVGQGLLGQPKAYVPGQTFRNWLRYFTP